MVNHVSGIIGGKFLERSRVKKPNQPLYSTKMSEYYLAQDLFVGACVDFNNHKFILIDADEYAFRYMENNAREVGIHYDQLLFPFRQSFFIHYQTTKV